MTFLRLFYSNNFLSISHKNSSSFLFYFIVIIIAITNNKFYDYYHKSHKFYDYFKIFFFFIKWS